MNKIDESMKVHEQWYEDAQKQTVDTLPAFIKDVLENYGHDYGTICHAITACGLAAMYAANNTPQGGITGFQAGAIMWEFIRHWNFSHNKTGLRLFNYDNMLYPQYADDFEKVISTDVWANLQKEAKLRIEENISKKGFVHESVWSHWQGIADGKVPFGYRIKK